VESWGRVGGVVMVRCGLAVWRCGVVVFSCAVMSRWCCGIGGVVAVVSDAQRVTDFLANFYALAMPRPC